MRTEYYIYQRLVWDAEFRRAFAANRKGAIRAAYKNYVDQGHFSGTATLAGLEEEAYRRMGALHRTSKEIFPRLHNLLLAICGNEFFERVLASFFSYSDDQPVCGNTLEILEPFDGYVVGPLIWTTLSKWNLGEYDWIAAAMRYEWAVWQARRVAAGWPALTVTPPLADGASLVSADFDLKALLTEIRRLEICSVGTDVYKWRIKPAPGEFHAAIFPKGSDVAEVVLDRESSFQLEQSISEKANNMTDSLRSVLERIGLVLETSFLCCSREMACFADNVGGVPGMIEPQPH